MEVRERKQKVGEDVHMPVSPCGRPAADAQQVRLDGVDDPGRQGLRREGQVGGEFGPARQEPMFRARFPRILAERPGMDLGHVVGFQGVLDRHLPIGGGVVVAAQRWPPVRPEALGAIIVERTQEVLERGGRLFQRHEHQFSAQRRRIDGEGRHIAVEGRELAGVGRMGQHAVGAVFPAVVLAAQDLRASRGAAGDQAVPVCADI